MSVSPFPHNGQAYGEIYNLVQEINGQTFGGSDSQVMEPLIPVMEQAASHGFDLEVGNRCQNYTRLGLAHGRSYPVSAGDHDKDHGPKWTCSNAQEGSTR